MHDYQPGVWSRSRARTLSVLTAATLLTTVLSLQPARADDPTETTETVEASETAGGTLVKEGPLRASNQTEADMAAVAAKHEAWRENNEREAAGDSGGAERGEASTSKPKVAATQIVNDATSETLQVRRNNRNTRASAVSSTLGETAAANEGASVLYTGNTYASSSTNRGVNWAAVGIPAGPSDAPSACCDQDVLRDHVRDRTFSIMLYLNSAQTNGVVRLFVRNAPNAAPLCTYLVDPGGSTANVPDYPHMATSKNFLYMGFNNGGLNNAQMWRINLANLAACQNAAFNVFSRSNSSSHRVFVPTEGFEDSTTMIWAEIGTTTSLKIYRWPESTASPSSVTKSLSHASTFTNPDCRGGTGNFDFIERQTAWSASGFRLRGARSGPLSDQTKSHVTFWWNSAPDSSHAQAHLHGASFRQSDLALIATPHIWNGTVCFGFPAVDGNNFGEYGLSVAAGGRKGGGGSAAQGYVGVDDASTSGIGFTSVSLTAQGTHNRSDGRFGDYFTVRSKSECRSAWVGTNYSLLNGNTSSSHVNARYIEFGSSADQTCLNNN